MTNNNKDQIIEHESKEVSIVECEPTDTYEEVWPGKGGRGKTFGAIAKDWHKAADKDRELGE